METINTIITNWTALSNTPIDWSPTGGMIWLTGYMVIAACLVIRFTLQEIQKDRQVARQALYRQAEHVGYVRNLKRSFYGFQETM